MVESGYRASGRIQQGRDFGGMVGVIVHYSDLLDRAAHLEAACRTEECAGRLGRVCGAHAQQHGSADGGGRIARIVHARNLQGNALRHRLPRRHRGRQMQGELFDAAACGLAFRSDPDIRGTAQIGQGFTRGSAVGNGMGFHVGGRASSTASPSGIVDTDDHVTGGPAGVGNERGTVVGFVCRNGRDDRLHSW